MFSLEDIFHGAKGNELSKNQIIRLLKTTPEAFAAFEKAYQTQVLSQVPSENDFFAVNSRQAASARKKNDSADCPNIAADVKARIVAELLAQTKTYVFDGNLGVYRQEKSLPDGFPLVSNAEISSLPESLRPELTGNLMKKDLENDSYPTLLFMYQKYLEATNQQKKAMFYHHFRQGLDILDLDSVVYQIIAQNKNSMGHWLPQLVDANKGKSFFKIPATTIATVPITLLQLTRQPYAALTKTTIQIVDEWAQKAFSLDFQKEYFIKTGTYSSKFDFRNAYVHGEKEVRELGEYLLFIHYQALQMASPLSTPSIYGVSTTNEWVVREFIPDLENAPCIYKGLPLHTEFRVFVDCDSDQVLGIAPYWEPNTMKQRFGSCPDANSPHQKHDFITYSLHEKNLMDAFEKYKNEIVSQISNILPELNLEGQWSIDVMKNGDDFWLIDMALAEQSAFYDCVPKELRHPSKETWIPKIG